MAVPLAAVALPLVVPPVPPLVMPLPVVRRGLPGRRCPRVRPQAAARQRSKRRRRPAWRLAAAAAAAPMGRRMPLVMAGWGQLAGARAVTLLEVAALVTRPA